jgi:hypothetical protein
VRCAPKDASCTVGASGEDGYERDKSGHAYGLAWEKDAEGGVEVLVIIACNGIPTVDEDGTANQQTPPRYSGDTGNDDGAGMETKRANADEQQQESEHRRPEDACSRVSERVLVAPDECDDDCNVNDAQNIETMFGQRPACSQLPADCGGTDESPKRRQNEEIWHPALETECLHHHDKHGNRGLRQRDGALALRVPLAKMLLEAT